MCFVYKELCFIYFHIFADTKSETYKDFSDTFLISFSLPLHYSIVWSRLLYGATLLQSSDGKLIIKKKIRFSHEFFIKR